MIRQLPFVQYDGNPLYRDCFFGFYALGSLHWTRLDRRSIIGLSSENICSAYYAHSVVKLCAPVQQCCPAVCLSVWCQKPTYLHLCNAEWVSTPRMFRHVESSVCLLWSSTCTVRINLHFGLSIGGIGETLWQARSPVCLSILARIFLLVVPICHSIQWRPGEDPSSRPVILSRFPNPSHKA